MKVILVSLDQVWENKENNMSIIEREFRHISPYAPDLVIFPEMTLTGFTMQSAKFSEKLTESRTVEFFSSLAVSYRCNIAFGLIVSNGGNIKPSNVLVIINKNGRVAGHYSKIHPFSFSGEDNFFSGGNKLSVVKIDSKKIGLSICYDLRFPELFQGLSKKCGAIINIANWPKKRVSHWEILLKARAIENQVFMFGVNRTGVDGNKLRYKKSSIIINPNGDMLKGIQITLQSDIYDVNIDEVDEYRMAFPVKKDRKVELYKQIL